MNGASSTLPTKGTWEDDAWKIDSDDDEFVKASRTSKSAGLVDASKGGSSSGSTSKTGAAAAATSSRHAPPARPHPYPVTGQSSQPTSTSHVRSRASLSAERQSISSNSVATQSGWTLIERRGSGGSASITASANGTSPAPAGLEEDTETETPSKRRGSETEAKQMLSSIREDLDDVLRDPTQLLSRLSIRSRTSKGTSHGSSLTAESGSSAESTSRQAAAAAAPLSPTEGISPVLASVTGDGVLTAVPASTLGKESSIQPAEVVTLPEGMLDRKSSVRSERRRAKIIDCLSEDVVQMDKLRTLAWAGMPDDLRPMVWMLLLGYLPPAKSARASTLARKRAEYQSGVRLAFQRGRESLDQAIWHQIHIDVPRTNPGIALWQREATQRALERILYVWAIRHPASGYVQGINDLATPFFQVFLSAYISSDVEKYDVALLPPSALEALEADTFWCLSKLLDGIQDNYIFAQPGIQRQVKLMGKLVGRINPTLHAHLEEQGVEYMQFAFRWMNCLLMRELSVRNIVRMWDTYLAEGTDAFSDFHLYVCSCFLNRWRDELQEMDFQGIIMFLQSLPTQQWTEKETELLLADAFVKKSLFGGTAHLTD